MTSYWYITFPLCFALPVLLIPLGAYALVGACIEAWNRGFMRAHRAVQRARHQRRTHSEQLQQEETDRMERERRKLEADRLDGERQNRERARFECQLVYDQNAVELRNRFPRERLAEYFESYMTCRHAVDEVEQRASDLKQLLQDSVEPRQRARFSSISEARAFFRAERDAVLEGLWDEDTKQTLLASLNRDEDKAIGELAER